MGAERPSTVLILGGGTAGWMAANLIAHRWGKLGTRVSLIESSEIGIVGVGEGSTPQLKHFFDTLGIAEAEWMPRCNATYKTGIGFHGWSDRPGFESYFHPFPSEADSHTAPAFFYNSQARRTGRDVPAHPDSFFLNTRLAAEGRAPLAPAGAPRANYGYHFDAHLVGATLREYALKRGVEHVDARVASVELGPDGDVAALLTTDGRRLHADFFIDASGFRALIIEGALGVRHLPFAGNLFNDRAVVTPTPLPASGPGVCTLATAKSAGWIWHIPLTNRAGNGYVYSSRYLDPEAAAAELRGHLGLREDAEVRHLQMRVGRMERSWAGNCLAVGLAQGFLEPLEATALHIVLTTVEGFLDAADRHGLGPDAQEALNAEVARRYEGIRDYIVCHYRTALRRDTQYWRDAAALTDLSDSLRGIITAWFTGADLVAEVAEQDIAGYYSAQSWHCMLAGYGNFPDPSRLRPPGPDIRQVDLPAIERFVSEAAHRFPPHRDALAQCAAAA